MTRSVLNLGKKAQSATPSMAAVALILLAVSACGSVSDPRENKIGNFLVAPGKYQLYDCRQLAQQSVYYITREKELREARMKAEAGPGGELISAIGYGSEYGMVSGNIDELRREVTEKKCDPPPPGLMPETYVPNIGQGRQR